MPSKTSKKTRRGSPHAPPEIRYAQLVDAAVASIGEHGYHATTIDGIAEMSGLSKGTLYRFFSSKDDLLSALTDEWERAVEDQWARLPKTNDVLHDLKAYCFLSVRRYVDRLN